ncbi:MAG: FAD-dependent oxidoreductase, partial [Leptospira sp.]|nr:FAD-dependent oxidoreductase [Leptospira sp.]
HGKPAGKDVAVIGAGGIGYDVSIYLTDAGHEFTKENYLKEWGIDTSISGNGGLATKSEMKSDRKVTMLKRSSSKFGGNLGKTTGWIHKTSLEDRKVDQIAGVEYKSIDKEGVLISVKGVERKITADTVVICAGQDSRRELFAPLQAAGLKVHLIGGADLASELDAKRAIDQGTRLAIEI